VPPFPGSISKIFNSDSPFAKHGDLLPFVAFKNGEPVGRIAAIENRTHNSYHKEKAGFFGFFDCVDDPEVAKELFNKAKEELGRRGLDPIRGPYNPSVNDECGLLIEGFESSPMVMMPYNPPYYLKLYQGLGLNPFQDLLAFYISANVHAPERVRRIVERVQRSSGFTIRSVDMSRLKEDLKIIHELYNVTLNRNAGFHPLTFEELEFIADDLKQIADPSLVLIAEKKGVPAGFSLALPNINELMWKARSKSSAMRVLKFVWYLKTKQPKEARLAILGVRPEYRNTGIGALFYYETLMRGKKKYIGGELSWVEDTNHEIIKGITLMGGKKYKTYRIYEVRSGLNQ
jgi:GNAT superfamily N-acetyltransferase